jgi:hypothetical protein
MKQPLAAKDSILPQRKAISNRRQKAHIGLLLGELLYFDRGHTGGKDEIQPDFENPALHS